MARPKDEMGSQIVSSEFDVSHPIFVYRTTTPKLKLDAFELWQLRSLNFQSFSDLSGIRWRVRGVRGAPAPRDSLNFRRASLRSRNEFESGTFTIVLHATSSFIYVSVIYGANFPFNLVDQLKQRSPFFPHGGRLQQLYSSGSSRLTSPCWIQSSHGPLFSVKNIQE